MTPDKPALRMIVRAARDGFAAAGPAPIDAPAALVDRLSPGLIVAGYVAIGSEADPSALIAAARAAGCRIALPHVTARSTPLRFLEWPEGSPLEPGPFGLRQPCVDAAELAPDIILTPLVAFDAALHRLGQGAGHYDRAFARYPDAWRVGVAWSVQQVAAVPLDIWDVPLHAVITETDILIHGEA